jgi:hypothetical protein
MNKKKIFLAILALILIVIGIEEPMVLIFPMWICVYLAQDKLKILLQKIPPYISFIGAGLIFGLLTESFAVMENMSKPAEQRIQLSPDPATDLLFGLFYYLCVMLAWYLLLRKFKYSKKEVFFITGFYGILVEETGQVFLRIFTVPVLGFLYATTVMFVYGIFPMLAQLLNENRFENKEISKIKRYGIAAVALFVQYAIYGLLILPILKSIFS